jgi:hypothetical protein
VQCAPVLCREKGVRSLYCKGCIKQLRGEYVQRDVTSSLRNLELGSIARRYIDYRGPGNEGYRHMLERGSKERGSLK